MSCLGLQVFLTGLWNLKDIQNLRQNRSKNKLVRENAATRAHGSCSLVLIGSWVHPRSPLPRHFPIPPPLDVPLV